MSAPTAVDKHPQPNDDLARLTEARHHDPFSILGRHITGTEARVRVFIPHAVEVSLVETDQPLTRQPGSDLFECRGPADSIPEVYRIRWRDDEGQEHTGYDPYCFPAQLADFDLHLFGEGRHWHAYRMLGAHLIEVKGVKGVQFAVWAPEAERVSVVGGFNRWDGRRHPMRVRGASGVWEIFLPGVQAGDLYKFEIRNRQYGDVHLKIDPYARYSELRPGTASIVQAAAGQDWDDQQWMQERKLWSWQHAPVSVYEVHLGSWQRDSDGRFLNYRELARRLVEYVKPLGFTHLELLPVTEHPLDISWGYQGVGYYAPTSRFGTPDDFRYFVDYCHCNGLGVILDWAPGHFPKDRHALARFDGSALYEHSDPRRGEHRDWDTLIFNYGRNEVRNFLLSSAVYWMEEFHIDGLRVDAVASMLYLDYSREPNDWIPNEYGGRENLEAIDFLRELNEVIHGQYPGALMMAEESTAWPQVTRPTTQGGLGFSMKWNMGWMHDTLAYMEKDSIHKAHHHNQLTFGLLYAFTENFVLPFSHDEVVHGKQSMLYKMPGDSWQQFANLRLLYTYMLTYPGKKLLFMGCEFAQRWEWNCETELSWDLTQYEPHSGMQALVRDLNHLYRDSKPLHQYDFEHRGFEWIDCLDASQSVISYIRRSDDGFVLVVLNFTPVLREQYRLGVPAPGSYREILNSDSSHYGGANNGNAGCVSSEPVPYMGQQNSISITLPPLAGLVFRLD